MAISQGIRLKKKFGQHFLRDKNIVRKMCEYVDLTPTSNIIEIGCGEGMLTGQILQHSIARLWVFEIDPAWAGYVRKSYPDKRLTIFEQDILATNFAPLEPYKPWIMLANLPYGITFPILHILKEQRHLFAEGVIMVQEEVAQKIVRKSGRGYGFVSLYFQHFFNWKLLDKIPPSAFYPPPKISSRLLHFTPRQNISVIPNEEQFWSFIKACFHSPRRTLRNNLVQFHFDLSVLSEETLKLRAQQMTMEDLVALWKKLH